MRWLLTTPADVDVDELRREVEAAGGKLQSSRPVPLEPDEQVLRAEGPTDFKRRLDAAPLPVKVNRHSEPEPYQAEGL